LVAQVASGSFDLILLFFAMPSDDCLANLEVVAEIVAVIRCGYFVSTVRPGASMEGHQGHRFLSDGRFCVLVLVLVMFRDHVGSKPVFRVFGSVNEPVGVAPAAR
jgi:hypothetical protein